MEAGGNYASVTLMPYLAANVPDAVTTMMNLAPNATPVAAIVFGLTMMVSQTLGFLLFGLATLRANMLSRWASLLLIIGVLLALGSGVSPLIGLGLVWMGVALWVGKDVSEPIGR